MTPLKIGASKVCKLMESAGSDRPESIRTAFVGRNLGGYGEARVPRVKLTLNKLGRVTHSSGVYAKLRRGVTQEYDYQPR